MAGELNILSRAQLAALSTQLVGSRNIIDWKYYDTLSIANGNTQLNFNFFQQAPGGVVGLETCNMDIPGQLPKYYEFVVEQIGIRVLPSAAVTLTDFVNDQIICLHKGILQFFPVGGSQGRPFYQDELIAVAGGGLAGFAAAEGTTGKASLFYAQSRYYETGKLEYMPRIDSNTAFSVKVSYETAPNPSASVKMRVKLIGKLIRPNSA